jgi:predicted enzyme related to lactoylglutathione lyase
MTIRIQSLSVDCFDPQSLADFWQPVLGWRRTIDTVEEVVLEPPVGSLENGVVPDLLFLRVPEDKTVKNRLHLDLRPDDRDAEVSRVEALGASRVDIGQSGDESWVVMADPDGNEFCVLRALSADDHVYEGSTPS